MGFSERPRCGRQRRELWLSELRGRRTPAFPRQDILVALLRSSEIP